MEIAGKRITGGEKNEKVWISIHHNMFDSAPKWLLGGGDSSLSSNNGRIIYEPWTEIQYSEDGKDRTDESVNKYGNTEKYVLYDDGEVASWYEYRNEYDGEGRLIRTEIWYYTSADDGSLDSYDVFEYDGNTRYGKTYDDEGELYKTSKAILNEKGLLMQVQFYDIDGGERTSSIFFYDDHGHYTRAVHKYNLNSGEFNPYGIEQRSIDWKYTYKKGHPVSAAWTVNEVGKEDRVYSGTSEFVY